MPIILDGSSENLQAVMSGAATTTNPDFFSSWAQMNATDSFELVDNTNGTLNGTTDVNLVAGVALKKILIRQITIFNRDTATVTITIKHDTSGTERTLRRFVLQANESVEYSDTGGWMVLNSSGFPVTLAQGGPVDVQSSVAAGAGTWTKPTTFTPKFVKVIAYGGGGGGGGGSSNTGAVVRSGGCGGGGGARFERVYLASDLSASESFSVGSGGTAGAAGASGADGGAGGVGGITTFSSGINRLTSFGGGGGALGDNASSAGAGGSGGGKGSAGATGTTSAATGGLPGPGATPVGGGGANSLATAGTPVLAENGGGAGGGHSF